MTVTAYQFAVAAVVFSPFALARTAWPTPAEFVLLAILGGLLTMASQTLFIASLSHLSTSFASILVSLQPIYAVAAAALLLGEVPRPRVLVGGGLVLCAVTLALATRAWARPRRGRSDP